jgi:hypothetical protein
MPAHMPPSFKEEVAYYKRALAYAQSIDEIEVQADRVIVLMAPFFQHRGHILMPIPEGFGLQQVWPRTGVVLRVGSSFEAKAGIQIKPGDELLFNKLYAVQFFGSSNLFADHSRGTDNKSEMGFLRGIDIIGKIEHDLLGKLVRWTIPGQPEIPEFVPWPAQQQARVVEECGVYGGLARCERVGALPSDDELLVPYNWMVRDAKGVIATF